MCESGIDDRIIDYQTSVNLEADRVVIRMALSMRIGRLLVFLTLAFFAVCIIVGFLHAKEFLGALIVLAIAALILIPFGFGVVKLFASHRDHPLTIIHDHAGRVDSSSRHHYSADSISRLLIHGKRRHDSFHRLYAEIQDEKLPVFLYQHDRPASVRELAERLAQRWGKEIVID